MLAAEHADQPVLQAMPRRVILMSALGVAMRCIGVGVRVAVIVMVVDVSRGSVAADGLGGAIGRGTWDQAMWRGGLSGGEQGCDRQVAL